MKFSEALRLLSEGRKVRQQSWKADQFIHVVDEHLVTEKGAIADLVDASGNWEKVAMLGDPKMLPIDSIVNNRLDKPDLKEMIESIKKIGVMVPLRIRADNNVLMDGLVRFLAAKAVGLKEIPCVIYDMTDDQVLEHSLHMIVTKPEECSKHLRRILDTNPTLTVERLAARLSKSPEWVRERLEQKRSRLYDWVCSWFGK